MNTATATATLATVCPAGAELGHADKVIQESRRAMKEAARKSARALAEEIYNLAIAEEQALFNLAMQASGKEHSAVLREAWQRASLLRLDKCRLYLELV